VLLHNHVTFSVQHNFNTTGPIWSLYTFHLFTRLVYCSRYIHIATEMPHISVDYYWHIVIYVQSCTHLSAVEAWYILKDRFVIKLLHTSCSHANFWRKSFSILEKNIYSCVGAPVCHFSPSFCGDGLSSRLAGTFCVTPKL
jgi:hypothetical protein